tara:strand:+ start:1513 stop:1737 length:225 start_codon:yes stop_codon:yes gene_type:complete
MSESPFITKKRFSAMTEEIVRTKKMSYIDAIVHLCEENKIEIEDSKKYINTIIKDKIESEAMDLNFLEKKNTLF